MDHSRGPRHRSSVFADQFPDAVVIVSLRDRRCEYANAAAERMLGEALPSLFASPRQLAELVAAEDRPLAESLAAGILAGEAVHAELRFQGGALSAWLAVRAFPMQDTDDPSLLAIVCEDISLRKPEELARHSRDARLALVAEHIGDVIWITAPDGTQVHYVSPAYQRVWQRSVDELYAAPFKWMQSIDPEDQARVLAMVTLEQAKHPLEYQFRIRHADGDLRQIRNRSVPLPGVDGHVMQVVILSEDITDEYRRSRQAEESARAQRDALVREVHHRIKNNLQGVTGMMRNYANQHPEIVDVINEAIAQVQAVAIIHGLQGQSGATQVLFYDLLKQVVFGIGQLMHRVLDFPPPDCCRNCRIIVSEMEAVPVALVLNEMIFNALKHGSADSAPVIDIQVDIGEERIELSVSNAGSLPDTAGRPPGGGSGLLLIRSLLPSRGAHFDLLSVSSGVEARLVLGPPIITLRC